MTLRIYIDQATVPYYCKDLVLYFMQEDVKKEPWKESYIIF